MINTMNPPVNSRQLLEMFRLYIDEKGLASVLSRFDMAGVTRRQIEAVTLGRLPETIEAARDGADFKARPQLAAALHGELFQTRIRETVLNAFPEKRRLIFVHIPKCAGTDLISGMRRRYAMLHNHLEIAAITPKLALFTALRELMIDISLSGSIAVAGHVPLRWYMERNLVRYEDDVFSTVRAPQDMVYSYIAFILTRLVDFQGVKRNDTTNWLAAIGMTEIPPDPPAALMLEIGGMLLRSPVTTRNMICNNLGRGTEESALENMALTGIELTDMKRYSAWRAQKFGFKPEKRINESKPLYTRELAAPADRALIEEMTDEDTKLYERIIAKLNASEALSVSGGAFA
jgi:hypothetical protein